MATRSGPFPDSGQSIGAYEIQGLLGRGGMGEVFLAWDHRLRRRVAIKRVRSDRGVDSPWRQRLLREARAVAGLSHPAIVQVYDLIEGEAEDCIVLEYVEGKTLAATMDGGALEPAHAVRLAHEIAEGLAAAHAVGIVHRDLKAENVIVTPTGHAKILDFGLARLQTRTTEDTQLTQDGVLLGTFHMMSPEQATGGELDERSDLFSLGIVMYEMLTGLSPFHGATPSETLRRVLSENPPRVDAVRSCLPDRLGDLVEDLLAKEPGARPSSAAEVARALELISTLLTTAAAPAPSASISDLPTVVDIPRSVRSHPLSRGLSAPASTGSLSAVHKPRMRKLIAALLGVMVVGVLVFLAVRPSPDRPLRIAVFASHPTNADERFDLAAMGVLDASFDVLSSLEGVDAMDQSNLPGSPKTLSEIRHAAAADEILIMDMKPSGNHQAIISITRKTSDGHVVRSKNFLASVAGRDLLHLSRMVEERLVQCYRDRKPRSAFPLLEARPDDYVTFLTVKRKLDLGAVPSEDHVKDLQQVMDKSPHLLGAHILEADVLLSRYWADRKPEYLDRAMDLIIGSRGLVKGDSRPVILQFRIEFAQDKLEAASGTLEQIRSLLPGDPRVLVLRSNLVEREGRLDDARKIMRKAVDTSPTWRNLQRLAKLEARTQHVDDARQHLGQILESSPDNIFALDALAWVELLFGDVHKAELQYQKLTQAPNPRRAHYTNLGVARTLLGHYESAIESFEEALRTNQDDVAGVYLNLAQAELALDRWQEADQHFQTALIKIERNPVLKNSVSHAECLAYLHRKTDAASIIQEALKKNGEDPEVLKSAALVYALLGEQSSAMADIRAALAKGVQPDWFRLPGFSSLRDNPDFRSLIGEPPGALH